MRFPFYYFLVCLMVAAGFFSCGSANVKTTAATERITSSLASNQRMDTSIFWGIMDLAFETGRFDNRIREKVILDQVLQLSPSDIQEFEMIFQDMNQRASTWGNYAAQVIIEEGSSDDSFYYFRCWLISLGKENFEKSIANPDHLATLEIPFQKAYDSYYCQFEELLSISDRAYEKVTGKDPSSDSSVPRDNASRLGKFYDSNTALLGKEWKEEDLPNIAPVLYKKYHSQ